jgi:peptidoglycan/xylan/chitin deacetylase (PgdA/CDA1 family)
MNKRSLFALAAALVLTLSWPAPALAQFPVAIAHAHPTFGFDQAVFTQWMDFLVANDYHTVTPDQFYEWHANDEPMPIRPILLTFDDNYIRMYSEIFPILQARKQHVVNFAHTNYVGVGGANDHADWAEIQTMETDGAVITESHTVMHLNLTGLTPTSIRDEVWNSKAAVEANIAAKTCYHIAYPYGGYNASIIAECQAAGYRLGYTTLDGLNYHSTPPFEIRRIPTDGVSLEVFKTRIGFYNLPSAPPGDGWILDNTDVNFFRDTAAWTSASAAPAFFHTDYAAHTPGDGSKPALWAAYLPNGGMMRVHARWPADPANASNATFRIQHLSGATNVAANLRAGGGQWNLLGTFQFSASEPARVSLLDAGDGTLVADAVWFEPVYAAVDGWLLY